jgi:hypothetical protein
MMDSQFTGKIIELQAYVTKIRADERTNVGEAAKMSLLS